MKFRRSRSSALLRLLLLSALSQPLGCTADGRPSSGAITDTCVDPVGLGALTLLDRLPFLRRAVHARTFTSADRDDPRGNMDYNQYAASDAGENTLFDVRGPGMVTRFWRANLPTPGGEYRFYFDGEAKPSLVFDADTLWSATLAPFKPPLTLDATRSSGGAVTFLPITFQRGLRITDVRPPEKDYYQIDYVSLPGRTLTSGVSRGRSVEHASKILRRVGENPNRRANDPRLHGQVEGIPSETSVTLGTLVGPAQIVSLQLALDPQPSAAALAAFAEARLQITWDDASEPAVDAPLGMFFAHGNGIRSKLRTLLVGNHPRRGRREQFYAYFPMPFARSAQIVIRAGKEPLGRLRYIVKHRPFTADVAQVGYFHARHTVAAPQAAPLELLSLSGVAGHYVGLVFVPNQGADLEGDPNFYIDGRLTPISIGTGSEDYFNGGWYYDRGSFARPLHGAILAGDAPDGSDRISQYRFHPADPIPFASDFRLTWEMAVGAQAVAYYYAQSTPLQRLTDTLDLGVPADAQQHEYVLNGAVGAADRVAVAASDQGTTGRLLSHGARSTFVVRIDPDNDGVTLRRQFVSSLGAQRAQVQVQGRAAGTWQTLRLGAVDSSVGDDEFYIPPSITRGESRLTVTLTIESEQFGEDRYRVFSRRLLRKDCR